MDLKPKTILRRVLDFARAELERRSRPPESSDMQAEPGSEAEPYAEHAARAPATPCMLDVARTAEGTWRVQWSMSNAHVQRSEALAGKEAVLCLRLVTFEPARDDVRREVVDRPFVDLSGSCDLGAGELRGVVAVGLRSGDRFVSIVHHTV